MSLEKELTNAGSPIKALTNKTAFVTGGSRGIGAAIAARLAADGALVAITYNASRSAAEQVVKDIEKDGGSAFALYVDLTDAAAIPALFDQLDSEFTKRTGSNTLNILVNNAGNSGWGGLSDATPETWDTMFAVHARAPFFVVQSALGRLSDGGRIINISSGAATRPIAVAPIYSAAKAATNNLTHSLAITLGPRQITVNAVAPGWIRTEMNAAVRENADMVKAIEAGTALGRFGETSEISSVVAFLAGDDSRWLTGQVIEASGGYKL